MSSAHPKSSANTLSDTPLSDLETLVANKDALIAVIGLGYVGLPLACVLARAGFDVLGVELKAERVNLINSGVSPLDSQEPGMPALLSDVVTAGQFRATGDYAALADRDVVLVNVETPVDDTQVPRYEALRSALTSLGPVLKSGALVIIESTVAPGTMNGVVCPLLESSTGRRVNEGFFLGVCPERVMPGRLLANLATMSRVIGANSPATAAAMLALYGVIVQADLDVADWITAELVKTVENTYRDVQIAFANEVALICEALKADVWEVRELVNKSPHRDMHLPGAGVGGHCIPKDPWLLAHGVANTDVRPRLLAAARAINDSMPDHVAGLVAASLAEAGSSVKGAKVLILGYAYLEDTDDSRNSPSASLARTLHNAGATVVIHDPFISEHQGDLYTASRNCHAAVLMVKHTAYHAIDLATLRSSMRLPVLIDGRHMFDAEMVRRAGFAYTCIGMGSGLI